MRVPFKGAAKRMEDTDKAGDKIFGFVQREKEFFKDIGNSLKEAVEQGTVLQEKRPEGIVDGEDQMPVSTVDKFKGHSSRPVIRIFGPAGRAKLGVASKRDKLEGSAMGTGIHGATIRGIPAVDGLFNVFHDNRSRF